MAVGHTSSLYCSRVARMSSVRSVSSPSRGLSGMMASSICSWIRTASCSFGCECTAYCRSAPVITGSTSSARWNDGPIRREWQTYPVAREAALFNDDPPPLLRRLVKAREQHVQVTGQRRRVRDLVLLGPDELGEERREGPVDVLPRPPVRVPKVARHGRRGPDVQLFEQVCPGRLGEEPERVAAKVDGVSFCS